MSEMRWETLSVDGLKPAAYNPRKKLKKGDKEYEKIKNSILEFGYVEPIIVNKDMTIIGGHQRLTVLRDMGYTEVQCVVIDIDKTREKALNIALNKITGAWDDALLADLLKDIEASDFNLDFTGFDAAEVDDLFTKVHDKDSKDDDFDVDKASEEEPFVKPGDIWTLGRHRLMCGDSTKAEDVKKLMNGVKANMCLTDPPYNCDISGGTGLKIMNDNMDSKSFHDFLLAAFKNIYDSLDDGAAVYIFHSDSEKVNFFNATVEAGFHYSTTCTWIKNSLVLGRGDYQQITEPIIYAFKNTARHKFYGDRKNTTAWHFDRPTKSPLHPTMKSIPLLAYPIRNSSKVNGVVLDLFGGSGSTMIACDQIDRIAYLMELDPKYASVIVKRYLSTKDGNVDDIYVIRDGQKLTLDEVLQDINSEINEDSASEKPGAFFDAQKEGGSLG